MSARLRLIRMLPFALIVLVILGVFVWPLVGIQLRLTRNSAVAARLVDSLNTRFPGTQFRGIASYEREVVYISILGGLAPERYPEVEQLLRDLKAEWGVAPAVWLGFPEHSDEEKDWVKL